MCIPKGWSHFSTGLREFIFFGLFFAESEREFDKIFSLPCKLTEVIGSSLCSQFLPASEIIIMILMTDGEKKSFVTKGKWEVNVEEEWFQSPWSWFRFEKGKSLLLSSGMFNYLKFPIPRTDCVSEANGLIQQERSECNKNWFKKFHSERLKFIIVSFTRFCISV